MSGIDILHGTLVLDIKPFIPQYDSLEVDLPLSRDNREHLQSSYFIDALDLSSMQLTERAMQKSLIEITKFKSAFKFQHLHSSKFEINTEIPVKVQQQTDLLTNNKFDAQNTSLISSTEQTKNYDKLSAAADNDLQELCRIAAVATTNVHAAHWLSSVDNQLNVVFNPIAVQQLAKFSISADDESYRYERCLIFFFIYTRGAITICYSAILRK